MKPTINIHLKSTDKVSVQEHNGSIWVAVNLNDLVIFTETLEQAEALAEALQNAKPTD